MHADTVFFFSRLFARLYRGLMHISVTFNLALRFILLSKRNFVFICVHERTLVKMVFCKCTDKPTRITRFHISHANSKTLI